MTLDPIHVDNIARLAGAIAEDVDETDHDDLAQTVWDEWLTPLRRGGRVVFEPIDEHTLRETSIDDAALAERPFEPVHGLDSGTINPTTFKNGLVVDVAQAAMASVPTNLDLHRSRSLVATVHTADTTVDHDHDWVMYDGGYSRRRVLHVPRINRYAEGVVHALALYLAESDHALTHANTVTDLLILDGPIYPKELLTWEDRDPELGELAREAKPRAIVENYVRLVEEFLEQDIPLVGFVKNPSSRAIVRTLTNKGVEAPWADDAGFFTRLLERQSEDEREQDTLTFTSWFRSRGGADEAFADDGDALGIDRQFPGSEYEVTFFMLYEPRHDVIYKIEAPAAFTRDPETRAAVTQQILGDVAAAAGPPPAVAKADELARIRTGEKAALRRKFEEQFDSERLRTYDDSRWGITEF